MRYELTEKNLVDHISYLLLKHYKIEFIVQLKYRFQTELLFSVSIRNKDDIRIKKNAREGSYRYL